MKIIGVASAIIKLVYKAERKSTQNFRSQCRKKIGPRYRIRYTAAKYIRNGINKKDNNRCNNKVAEFQVLVIFKV
jgi:hypothetical protein